MRSLRESLLDDEDIILGDMDKSIVEDWVRSNLYIQGSINIVNKKDKFIVNCHGDVWGLSASDEDITSLPVTFGKINGNFDVKNSNIETLKGFPTDIDGYLNLSFCENLKELDYLPNKAKAIFLTDCKNINTLKGCENIKQCEEIGLSGTSITNLKYLPKDIKTLNLTNCKKLTDYSNLPNIINTIAISGKKLDINDFLKVKSINKLYYYTAIEASMSSDELQNFKTQLEQHNICHDFKLIRY